MLTKKDIKYLKSLAQKQSPLFQVGKDGVSENMLKSMDDAFEAHELVKINLLKTCPQTLQEVQSYIAFATQCEVIQVIGKTIVGYRRSKKNVLGL